MSKSKINISRSPLVMGILNVTPDSFSDGGHYCSAKDALTHAAAMIDAGADLIDVGGESTRPGAASVSVNEELRRVIPIIDQIVHRFDGVVSIDTSKPEVMSAAVAAGASMINDVYALRNEGAIDAAAELDCPVCLMHMQGEPRTMQSSPNYDRLPQEILEFLTRRIDACVAGGVRRAQIMIDPGFGFGKLDIHNLEILAKLEQFSEFDSPLLVGLSRKRTLGNLTGRSVTEREAAGIAAAIVAVQKGANIVRTHDVGPTVDALAVLRATNQFEDKIND
jgi:dihydropteroate synthase